jgi:hypothetical protein
MPSRKVSQHLSARTRIKKQQCQNQEAERGSHGALGTRLGFTQDSRQFLHDVTDEKIQTPGQVFIATLPFLAWSGLSAVPLDIHHQPTNRKAQC